MTDVRIEVGQVVDVDVRALASGGAGVADLPDGRVVFVHRTAPGDRARIRVATLKRSWGRGELVAVLEPGPGRREAPCPFYDRCGGCTLEHLTYRQQLEWKGRMIADALERIGGLTDVEPPPVEASEHEFRYRSRVSFHLLRLSGGRVVAGFHALENPGRILDIDGDCLLPEEPLARVWGSLKANWGPGAGLLPSGPMLRMTLRRVDEGVLLLVEPADPPEGQAGSRIRRGPRSGQDQGDPVPVERNAARLVQAVDGLISVWWRSDPSAAPRLLAGSGQVLETWRGRTVRLGPATFLQVNRVAAEALTDAVLEELRSQGSSGGRVLDAYAGVGAYGRALAAGGARVVAIEVDPAAVEAAREGTPDGLEVLQGRVEDLLPDVLPVDLAVLNPPRTGLHESIPARLRRDGPRRMVYVSCDPPTLARDMGRLEDSYRLAKLRAFDLFPQTSHVETVAVLERTDP